MRMDQTNQDGEHVIFCNFNYFVLASSNKNVDIYFSGYCAFLKLPSSGMLKVKIFESQMTLRLLETLSGNNSTMVTRGKNKDSLYSGK
jgi:hypothetical protein